MGENLVGECWFWLAGKDCCCEIHKSRRSVGAEPTQSVSGWLLYNTG